KASVESITSITTILDRILVLPGTFSVTARPPCAVGTHLPLTSPTLGLWQLPIVLPERVLGYLLSLTWASSRLRTSRAIVCSPRIRPPRVTIRLRRLATTFVSIQPSLDRFMVLILLGSLRLMPFP